MRPYRGINNPKARKPRLTARAMKLVPCKPYKKGSRSRRVRKNKWVAA